MTSDFFISVDWGTSNLRISIVDSSSLKICELLESDNGVKQLHMSCVNNGVNRKDYFTSFIKNEIQKFKTPIPSFSPIIISGMASSSIGVKELPYAHLPFKIDGTSLFIDQIESNIFLVSGVKSENDVIRGEEVQLLGLSHLSIPSKKNIFIFPGTHSKHIVCVNDEVVDFKTFMTGEFFETIANFTILKNSVEHGDPDEKEMIAFEKGVKEAQNEISILNSLFKIRTNSLFGKMNSVQNYYFLSGLIIGEELKNLEMEIGSSLFLCAGGKLFNLYKTAVEVLGLNNNTTIVPQEVVDTSVIRGHYKILKKLK